MSKSELLARCFYCAVILGFVLMYCASIVGLVWAPIVWLISRG